MSKNHIVFLTEEELKALANGYRVAMKLAGETPYIETLQKNGGKTGFDKLLEKIREINDDANGE